jgi:hypothetical protein
MKFKRSEIRGNVTEFGLCAARGVSKIKPLLDRIATNLTLPPTKKLMVTGEVYRREPVLSVMR